MSPINGQVVPTGAFLLRLLELIWGSFVALWSHFAEAAFGLDDTLEATRFGLLEAVA